MILDIRKLFQIAFVVLALALLLSLFTANKSSAYDPLRKACQGAAASSPACQDRARSGNPLTGPGGLITRLTRLVAILVGIASILMIMLGGFTYITSTGDAQKTKAAKDTILYAIIGLVISAAAGVIIGGILSAL